MSNSDNDRERDLGIGTSAGAARAGWESPTTPRKRNREYGDRFIPSRTPTLTPQSYSLHSSPSSPSTPRTKRRQTGRDPPPEPRLVGAAGGEVDAVKEESNRAFSTLLSNELFGPSTAPIPPSSPSSRHRAAAPASPKTPTTPRTRPNKMFSYMPPPSPHMAAVSAGLDSPAHDKYSVSPVRWESQRMLQSPRRGVRKIQKVPFKVLDAPDLADDFYLNLVDWSSTNILGVGLGSSVYLWSAHTSKVTQLCNVAELPGSVSVDGDPEHVTSLQWIQKGNHLAIGTSSGAVQIWDAAACRHLRTMSGHASRVGALAWSSHLLTSGSRDRSILHRDVREPAHYNKRLSTHRQEVCGLAWNAEEDQLASGGNDNKLFIWDSMRADQPLWRYGEHTAAVKALAWNPHHRGILASGGGTADRKIRFWDTVKGNGKSTGEWDTGSQVCNLMFSKTTSELVSTHGYSGSQIQNQIALWRYPTMTQVATLTGHTYRVLYLAMSPDGQTIVTGAGDETLRFWNVFPPAPKNDKRRDDGEGPIGTLGRIR